MTDDLRQQLLAWREADDAKLTPSQVEYNVASTELLQLGAYGHFKHWPAGVTHPSEYLAQLHAAQDRFEAAVLGLVQPLLAQRPGCPDPIECDHEAAAGQAEAEADQLREKHRRDLLASEESARILQRNITELTAELDRTRAELATAKACACYPNLLDHEDDCPTRAAAPTD